MLKLLSEWAALYDLGLRQQHNICTSAHSCKTDLGSVLLLRVCLKGKELRVLPCGVFCRRLVSGPVNGGSAADWAQKGTGATSSRPFSPRSGTTAARKDHRYYSSACQNASLHVTVRYISTLVFKTLFFTSK